MTGKVSITNRFLLFKCQLVTLASFLDLPWDACWLDNSTHARNKAIIHTPSYAQVIQPLNTKAMGRWRHYRPFFDAVVMARLEPAVSSMGYALD